MRTKYPSTVKVCCLIPLLPRPNASLLWPCPTSYRVITHDNVLQHVSLVHHKHSHCILPLSGHFPACIIIDFLRQSWTKYNETPHQTPLPPQPMLSIDMHSTRRHLFSTLAGGKGGCLINFVQDCLNLKKKIERGYVHGRRKKNWCVSIWHADMLW